MEDKLASRYTCEMWRRTAIRSDGDSFLLPMRHLPKGGTSISFLCLVKRQDKYVECWCIVPLWTQL